MELRTFDLPRYLSVLPLFQEMTAEELARLAQGSQLRRLARGDMVFRVGDPCDEFHVTVTGQVKLFAISPAGQEKVIELVGPGASFAEALMFTGKPCIVNAQALTEQWDRALQRAAELGRQESSYIPQHVAQRLLMVLPPTAVPPSKPPMLSPGTWIDPPGITSDWPKTIEVQNRANAAVASAR